MAYDDYEPDDEELEGGWEHCAMCGCCKRDHHENCTDCGHPGNGGLYISDYYPEGWDTWMKFEGKVPEIGEEFVFTDVDDVETEVKWIYRVVAVGSQTVLFDQPLRQSLESELGYPR